MYKKISAILGLMACLLLPLSPAADEFLEGKYVTIKPAQATQTGDKIEVVEVFWYGCPHCYSFEPFLEDWHKNLPDDVALIRLPGALAQNWIPHAKAYYTAEKLGIVEKMHRPLFDAIHKERKQLFTDKQLIDYLATHGVAASEVNKVYNSPEIDAKVRQSYFLARDYKLTGVPSIVINGKYLISTTHAGSFENVIKVMDGLIEQERQAKQ